MHPSVFTILPFLLFRTRLATAQNTYILDTTYSGISLFDQFDFFDGPDPTHGYVNYLDQNEAIQSGLVSVSNGVAYIGVDYHTTLGARAAGRDSVRMTSQKSWTHGLFIADFSHMPAAACAIWPAFWMFGPNWPNSGEVDIVEGISDQQANLMSLHTSNNCTTTGSNQLGTLQTNNCYAYDAGNSGCSVLATSKLSFGEQFNANLGGVYAMEWTSLYIRIWFFARGSIPVDITAGSPDPSTWGMPQANFEGGCDIDTHFNEMQLVFDTTFCGDWAGSSWSTNAVCNAAAATCQGYVANNPSAFSNGYWDVNSVLVYTQQDVSGAASPSTSTAAGTQESPATSYPASSISTAIISSILSTEQVSSGLRASSSSPASMISLTPTVSPAPLTSLGPSTSLTLPGPMATLTSNTAMESNSTIESQAAPSTSTQITSPSYVGTVTSATSSQTDYLPSNSTTIAPASQISGAARGGRRCNGSTTLTTITTTYVASEICTDNTASPLQYASPTSSAGAATAVSDAGTASTGSMADTGTTESTTSTASTAAPTITTGSVPEVQVSETLTVFLTLMEPGVNINTEISVETTVYITVQPSMVSTAVASVVSSVASVIESSVEESVHSKPTPTVKRGVGPQSTYEGGLNMMRDVYVQVSSRAAVPNATQLGAIGVVVSIMIFEWLLL